MVTSCLFSKFVDCVALEKITALATAHALITRIFYQHGAPRCILSDRGSQFTSTIFNHLLNILKIDQKLTTTWHSQCNGQAERANRRLCQMIRGYINDHHDNWEDMLEPKRFAYCNSVNSSECREWQSNRPKRLRYPINAELKPSLQNGEGKFSRN